MDEYCGVCVRTAIIVSRHCRSAQYALPQLSLSSRCIIFMDHSHRFIWYNSMSYRFDSSFGLSHLQSPVPQYNKCFK